MWTCRKIYANMLLLSVLIFALGASAVPQNNSVFVGSSALNAPAENIEFRWDCGSGRVVYRSQQITAIPGSDLNFVLPVKSWDVLCSVSEGTNIPIGVICSHECLLHLPDGRAPPEKLFV